MGQPRATRATRAARKVVNSSPEDEPEQDDSQDDYVEPTDIVSPKNESPNGALPTRSRGKGPTASSQLSIGTSTIASPQTTPKKKSPQKQKSKDSKSSSSRPIYSFFNASTQQQQQPSENPGKPTNLEITETIPEDVIEDESSEDDLKTLHRPSRGSENSIISNKRPFEAKSDDTNHTLTSGSRKFLKALDGSRASPSFSHDLDGHTTDDRPWAEKYAPQNLEELAVHKKKVSDVRSWLESVLNRQSIKRVLVLKGQAGNGKTSTIKILSKVLGFDCVEWSNPALSGYNPEGFVSQAAHFEDFLMRGRKFGGLELVGDSDEASKDNYDSILETSKHIMLVEEFPTSLTRSTDAMNGIRSTLLRFLAANTPSVSSWASSKEQIPTPVVLIISESVLSSNTSTTDSFTAHRLLGQDLLSHPGTTVIEFNAVAPTFLSKAQSVVLQKHANCTGNRYAPSQAAMQRISEFGDLRSAINTLEYLCLRQSISGGSIVQPFIKSKAKKPKPKTAKPSAEVQDAENAELSIISSRETTLGLFHAVGKVVYNKRTELNNDYEVHLPSHLSQNSRQHHSEVDTTMLLDSTGTDAATFLAALHENYALSCTPASGSNDATLDSINGCLDNLSDADILDRTTTFRGRSYAPGEGFRQQELAFELGVRGMLFNLPYPVKRQPKPGSRNYLDANKMYYPSSVKLWRQREELSGKLDLFVEKASKGTIFSQKKDVPPSHSVFLNSSSVSQPGRVPNPEPNEGQTASTEDSNIQRILLGSGHSPKHEMLLERVPYIVNILSTLKGNSGSHLSTPFMKEMDEVARFKGVGILEDEESDDEGGAETPRKASRNSNAFSTAKGLGKSDDLGVEKLVLSDDDIEDDDL